MKLSTKVLDCKQVVKHSQTNDWTTYDDSFDIFDVADDSTLFGFKIS